MIVLGTYSIGGYVLQQMKLADAAHVGGQYLISYPQDTAGMTSAINAMLPWTDVTITTTRSGATAGQVAVPCTANFVCPPGTTERFATVTLTRAFTPLLITGLTSTSATYVARVQ